MSKENKAPCCGDWEPNTKIINGFISMGVIHGTGDYLAQGGVQFRFCPWCSAPRETIEKLEKS